MENQNDFDGAAEALRACARHVERGGAAAETLAEELRRAADQLGEPMRLAVAGQIKRGKSTLVNALLGEEITLTGQLELTYTVAELCFAEQRVVTVHHQDGGSEQVTPADFHRMTNRSEDAARLLGRVSRVEYGLPNELLRSFRLADTPGLGSVHGLDSEGTRAYLRISAFDGVSDRAAHEEALRASGRTGESVHEDSVREVEGADAVLYLFDRGLHDRDRAGVSDFLGGGGLGLTPMSAFGVLSRCDQQWPPGPDLPGDNDPLTWDPMAESARIAEGLMGRPEVRGLFFAMVPVAGLLGLGAQTLTSDELDHLTDLARVEPRRLTRRLADAGRFGSAEQVRDVDLPAAHRLALVQRLGVWGIHLACGLLRDGAGEEELRARLVEVSGVRGLRDLIVRHFGNRATLIKLGQGLQRAGREVAIMRRDALRGGTPPHRSLGETAGRLERLRDRTPGFAELEVLEAHYRGELALAPAEIEQLLRITGEYGTDTAARLGLPADAPREALAEAALAGVRRWATREVDPGLDRASQRAAGCVRRGYEHLLDRVGAA
ncbi:dynamin family protein [Streptomyces sp. NPDC096339]|uniref:dynamin family protein n=1 Tax=Streptomyces sp. NPDC096339 TaxID=3366086 RepID=UPI0038046B64